MYTGNKKKKYLIAADLQFLFFIILILLLSSINSISARDNSSIVRAGLRSSVYGMNPFPDTTWWRNASYDMAARFDGAAPSLIWILGYTKNDGCYLNFPKPNSNSSYYKIYFSDRDENESYLNFFDKYGIQVWLQVEPGQADVLKLIDLVLTQYGHHPSVIGFGVDVEWYKTSTHNEGKAVSDYEAESWVSKINSYNENYLLFTKHWLISKMPPTYRTNMVFVDDSQIFSNMASMINEFADWAAAFSPAKVTFQFGYPSDKPWWNNLNNPPKDIGDEILKWCPNTSELYWVDFTAHDIWPEDFIPTAVFDDLNKKKTNDFYITSIYPNPFNPATNISFTLAKTGKVNLKIFNALGEKVMSVIDNEYLSEGFHDVRIEISEHVSGIYFLVMQYDDDVKVSKMVLMK